MLKPDEVILNKYVGELALKWFLRALVPALVQLSRENVTMKGVLDALILYRSTIVRKERLCTFHQFGENLAYIITFHVTPL